MSNLHKVFQGGCDDTLLPTQLLWKMWVSVVIFVFLSLNCSGRISCVFLDGRGNGLFTWLQNWQLRNPISCCIYWLIYLIYFIPLSLGSMDLLFVVFAFCYCAGIRGVLSEKSKCPKCSSDKFKAEHLLPNLSLRQAIEHFLESQIQLSISETALRRYAPGRKLKINNFLVLIHLLSWQWEKYWLFIFSN